MWVVTDPTNTHFGEWLTQQVAELGQRIFMRQPLRSEASHRRFERLELVSTGGQPTTLIAMASPPSLERNDAFVQLAAVFGDAGLPVPKVLAHDVQQGWLLLSDVGNEDFEACYGTPAEAPAMEAALAVLPRLQAVRSEAIEPYTSERLQTELGIYGEWLVDALLKRSVPQSVRDVFELLVQQIDEQPKVCVHRDFHCRNLLWNDGRLGIVDFQDALHGPRCYDLASLLHDCYHQWSEESLEHYREAGRQRIAPEQPQRSFQKDLEWTAIQRQLKAAGIFLRLVQRDGRWTHLAHVLPTLKQTSTLAHRYPELRALAGWLDKQQQPLADAIEALKARG